MGKEMQSCKVNIYLKGICIMGKCWEDGDVINIMQILDGFCEAGESRMKIEVTENAEEGSVKKQYHHGRCDVNSPWAEGKAFDLLE